MPYTFHALPAMIRCLLVDDDTELRQEVTEYLNRFGLSATAVADGRAMREAIGTETFDIVLLDLMLPGEDGLDLCRWLRQHSNLPVIMLTARGDPMSRVLGLEIGADDYVTKPFEPRELIARINAILRRIGPRDAAERADDGLRRFAGWQFDTIRHRMVSPDGVLTALSAAEYRLLAAFMAHPQQVLSRDRLLDLTRAPGTEVSDRSIDLAVSRLRKKLGHGADGELIRTLRNEGYLFDAEVT